MELVLVLSIVLIVLTGVDVIMKFFLYRKIIEQNKVREA